MTAEYVEKRMGAGGEQGQLQSNRLKTQIIQFNFNLYGLQNMSSLLKSSVIPSCVDILYFS